MATQYSKSYIRDDFVIQINQKNTSRHILTHGPVTKLKNLSDVHSILLGAVENDFHLFIQKESYKIASDLQEF